MPFQTSKALIKNNAAWCNLVAVPWKNEIYFIKEKLLFILSEDIFLEISRTASSVQGEC